MTNPAQAIRMLITYAICIPLAIFMGFIMTDLGNNPDYSNLFVVAVVITLLASPIFIKWHYPIMVFGLGCPMTCFFLTGGPPLWQVVVILSLGIAIIERTINSDRRFISVPLMTWPLLYTLAMILFTAEMTGGIGLHSLGGDVGGGKKYIVLFLGIATYFALTSRKIPKEKRTLYILLIYLSGLPAFIGDLFPYLPSPLNYINLLFPPSSNVMSGDTMNAKDVAIGITRMGAFAATAGTIANFMLARYGLRGIFSVQNPFRLLIFSLILVLTLLGGFRTTLIAYGQVILMLFFLEGLYRTRMLLVFLMGGILGLAMLVSFSDKLPYTFQRALTVVPYLRLDPGARMDAEGSKIWRETMWADVWPKVPEYLLLGKGYALSQQDFALMGGGAFEGLGVGQDASQQGLAISMDYHSGPLSTLMPFGIWGAISYLWVTLAGLYILYRNYRYGDADIKTINAFMLVMSIGGVFGFLFIVGAYTEAIAETAKLAGLSVALNWGICKPKAQTAPVPGFKPQTRPRAQLLPA